MIKFKDIKNSTRLAVADIKRKHSVNGEKSLSGTIYSGDDVINNIDTGWGLEFDSEPYVITYFEHHDSDNTISFDAIHKFFWDFSKKMFYRKFNGSNTIDTYLGNIFDGTGYKYALNFKPNAVSKENFGMTNKMSMFNDVINAIGAEFEVNGTLVSIYQKIGTDLSTIVRHGFNLSDMSIENDISGFATYAEGFGVHANPDDQSSPQLHAVYESPLSKIYGRIEAEPIDDERYTIQANLLSALKSKVDDSLPVSIKLSLYDLNKAGYPYKMAKVGDWITAVDERINFKQKIRIISVDDEFTTDGLKVSYTVTAGNISSVQRYQEANASISSRINDAIDTANAANQIAVIAQISADGKNTVYRVNSLDNLPTNANEGDLGWVQSGDGLVLYIYTKRPDGSFFWDKRIDPEMGQQIADGVTDAVNQAKDYSEQIQTKLKADINAASNQANNAVAQARSDFGVGINQANGLAKAAQDTADKANTDLAITKNNLANTVSDLANAKTDLTSKLNDKASISYVDTANGAINVQLINHGNSISTLKLNSDMLVTQFANTQGDVSTLKVTAKSLTTGLANTQGDVSKLKQQADGFELTVKNSTEDIANLKVKADSIQSQVSTQDGRITTVQQSADKVVTQVQGLNGRVATVEITAEGVSNLFKDSNGNQYTSLETAVSSTKTWQGLNGRIAEVKNTADGVSTAVNDPQKGLSAVTNTANSITSFVKDTKGNLSTDFMSALLRTNLMKGLDGGSSIMSQTATSISQAISDNNGNIVAAINLDPHVATIKSAKITLDSDTTVTKNFYALGGNFTNLNASNITAGSIDASKIKVTNIDAGNITAGTLDANKIKIEANKLGASLHLDISSTGLDLQGSYNDTSKSSYWHHAFNQYGIQLTAPYKDDVFKNSMRQIGGIGTYFKVDGAAIPNGSNADLIHWVNKNGGGNGTSGNIIFGHRDNPASKDDLSQYSITSDLIISPQGERMVDGNGNIRGQGIYAKLPFFVDNTTNMNGGFYASPLADTAGHWFNDQIRFVTLARGDGSGTYGVALLNSYNNGFYFGQKGIGVVQNYVIRGV